MELTNGTVAVVTGGASGIGLAMADALAREGCSVVLADVDDAALAVAAESVGSHGNPVSTVPTDVRSADAVQALAERTISDFGGVHVVCNNAGVAAKGDPWVGGIEAWEWVMDVNFWGVVRGIRAFLPHVVASGGGHIVNTASMAGLIPGFSPAYDASKHAVVAVSENLYNAVQMGGLPVGVSCLCPGWVRTGILDADRNWPSELGAAPTNDVGAEILFEYVRTAIDEGMQPAAVADLVVDAVKTGRYWVFPHPEFVEIAMERFHSIGEGIDPDGTGDAPGMPSREQVVAEVIEAVGAADEG